MKISTILDKVDENQLFIPAFQREYVWKRDDAKSLIESLIKEYPTGTMLTWETDKPPEFKGPYKYNEKQGAVKLLLDGQQRITTLYMLIRGKIPPYYTAPEIMVDTRGLYVNLKTLELAYYMKSRMDKDPLWVNITDVFQGEVSAFDLQTQFSEVGETVEMNDLKLFNENITKITSIKDREFPEQTIPVKATIGEAIDIFYKVNASGVALTDAELALAQISGYWPQARDTIKKKLAELAEKGFVFKLDFIVFALLGCMYHVGSEMRKLHSDENNDLVREAWARLDTQVLDYVANLIRTHAYVDHTEEINSIYALIPIIVYCYDRDGGHLSEEEIRKVVKWFYYSQVRRRFVSQMPQKLDFDLRIVAESEEPFDEMLSVIAEENRLEIVPDEFAGRSVSHPLYGLMNWYLKSRGAVCLTTGVGLHQPMGKKYQLESDHIFPYSRLKSAGYGHGENRLKYALAQELTNRALLTQVANRTKSAITAADYLQDVKALYPHALKLQLIPEDEELWKLERYEDFLVARRQLLADALNEYLDGITDTVSVGPPAQIEDLIAEGESDGLEFKSTLRWDRDLGDVNKKLEQAIVKTVAAFANADGGTLLIGVDDSGTVLGLESDYASMHGGERDEFEVKLRNLLNQQFSKTFNVSKIAIEFPRMGDAEICRVDVSRVHDPVVVTVPGPDGQKIEKMYVRSGNTSHEIPMGEVSAYLKERKASVG